MGFCKYCGARLPDEVGQEDACQVCKERIKKPTVSAMPERTSKRNGLIALAAIGVVVIIMVGWVIGGHGRCKADECRNKAVGRSRYCYSHKCVLSTCPEKRYAYSNYCYSHYALYDDNATSQEKSVYSWQLAISNVTLSSNSSYTIAEGRITNNSDSTVRFVEIKGAFQDSLGRVVDTDWTYAVGSEGLAPGESCKWRMSVSKDYTIKTCNVTILDYDS